MIDLKNKVIYIHIPKTAGTAVEQYFLDIRGLDVKNRPAMGIFINDKKSDLERQNGHCSLEMYESFYFGGKIPEEYKIFTVVRNPISRFWSEYRYRRLPPPNRFPIHMNLPASALKFLTENPVGVLKDLNSHMRSQYKYLEGTSCERVEVIKFENIGEDFKRLQLEWDLPVLPLPKLNSSKKRSLPKNFKFYEDWVREYYEEDFLRFGYD